MMRSGPRATGCPQCAEYGFNPSRSAVFYIRDIKVNNKRAVKFGITNQIFVLMTDH